MKSSLSRNRPGQVINLGEWLDVHHLGYDARPYQGGMLYVLAECPFSGDHRDGAYAVQFPSGAIFAGCHHSPGRGPVFPGTTAGIRRIGMRLSRRPTIEACFTKGCLHLKFMQASVRRNRICDLTGKGIGYLRVCPLEEACAAC